ncbi:hypothetical protein S40285_07242 [Stachybotrys chlorohalonatus IBT 40285]|uniref:Uncharacterized protein n=1 Tax=Stachybotrys chlorohalonatus (strain IBT 40285) TaxID=1283841 RepID=A0A084QGD1_STAC4|nr:hypothetical protein S40285_07242 [Stachybotrys chlorohalonata IBT 40285]
MDEMASFVKRQQQVDLNDLPPGWVVENGRPIPWWYSHTLILNQDGIIVKWAILLSFVVLMFAYFVGGYLHARWRLKKGLAPLAYHRCLVARRTYSEPTYPMYNTYRGDYGMHYAPPPPVYDGSRPPMYEGPGAEHSKVDPSQWRSEPTRRPAEGNNAPEYDAPPGPPPPPAMTRP